MSTIASERGRAVKLNINGDKLVLSVNNPEGGSATEEIGVEYDSSPLEIGFNAKYLLESPASSKAKPRNFSLPTRARRPWSRTTATRARSTC